MHAHQYFFLLAVAMSFLHVFIIQVAMSTVVLSDDNNCPLLLSLPLLTFHHNYTDNYSDDNNNYNYHAERDKMDQELASARYAELYMSYLAIQHVNSKNGMFVNELYDLSCDVKIPYVAVSNHADAAYEFLTTSSSSTTSRKDDKLKESDTAIIMLSNETNSTDLKYEGSSFCAVIGPVDSEAPQGTNLANYIADQLDMVQISPLSFDVDPMDNPQLLHSFFRSSATVGVLSRNLMKYLSWKERNYVAVLYDSSSVFSSLVWEGLQNQLPTNLITMVGFPHVGNDDVTLTRALTDIQSSRFSTIVWVESQFTDILKVAKAAYQLKLSTSEYMWIVVPHELMTKQVHWSLSMVRGSPLELFSRRVLLYEYNGARKDIENDEIISIHINDEAIHKVTRDTLRKISSLIVRPDIDRHNLNITNYLASAAYLYDSIVSMGLGLCAAKKMHDSSHYNGIRRASFTGITGHVRYNTLMNERGQDLLTMAMRHLPYFKGNQTDQYIDVSSFDEEWIDANHSYIYVLPDRVRNVDVTNHTMSLPTQYFFMLTGLIIIVVSIHLLLYINRNKHLTDFAVAQPMYLSLHCAGSIARGVCHFLFVGVRGGYQYGSLICSLLTLLRVIGILLICYTCFIKVISQNVKFIYILYLC